MTDTNTLATEVNDVRQGMADVTDTKARLRHKFVIGQLLADPSQTLYNVMIKAGYAHNTAIAPGKNLISQPGFQELVEEYLPDTMLLGALHDDIEKKTGNRKAEIELAFKVKGRLTAQEQPQGNTYNTFVQQNNIDPNTPDNKQLVKLMTDAMMSATKRKVIDV